MTTCSAAQKELKQEELFSADELASLNKGNIPHHVAIIPDGNRRWAKGHQLEKSYEGYLYGAETLITIVRAAKALGIKVLTVYTFSTENWLRPPLEVNALMTILEQYLRGYQQQLVDLSIRLHTIGDLKVLPTSLGQVIADTKQMTANCDEFDLVLALNYGARDELVRAIRQIAQDVASEKISLDTLTEERITQYLDTANFPDPDLLIRTSGEQRISNFLLWQSSYAEMYMEEVTWPDFTPKHLLSALPTISFCV